MGCTSPSQGTQSNTPQTSGQVSNTPSNTVTKTQTRKTTKHTAQRAFDAFKRSIETGEAQPFVDMVTDDVTFEIGTENGWYGVQRGKDAVVEHTRWRWNDEYTRTYSAPGAMRAGFEYYRAFPEDVRQNREYAKTKLKMPVLALGGASATNTLPLRQMREVSSDVRGGVMEGCGHWLKGRVPRRTHPATSRFLCRGAEETYE